MATDGTVFVKIMLFILKKKKTILELFQHVCSNVPVLLGSHRIFHHTVALAVKKRFDYVT
jgi:hypothetical protein